MALLRHGSSSGGKQGVQPSSTADRVLQHLLVEGIEQTPIGSKQHSRSRRHMRSSSSSSRASRSSSPGGDASEGSSKSSSCNGRGSGGSRRSSSRSGRRNASEQQQQLVEQQQHRKDELVLLERSALQAARRAASPERMQRCSSPDVADAAVSAAAASAAAAGVAQWAQQRRVPGPALRSHSTSRCVCTDCAVPTAMWQQLPTLSGLPQYCLKRGTVAGVPAHVCRHPSLHVSHAVVVQLLLASPGFTRPAAGRHGAAGPAVRWMRQRSSSTKRACWSCLSPRVHALQVWDGLSHGCLS